MTGPGVQVCLDQMATKMAASGEVSVASALAYLDRVADKVTKRGAVAEANSQANSCMWDAGMLLLDGQIDNAIDSAREGLNHADRANWLLQQHLTEILGLMA